MNSSDQLKIDITEQLNSKKITLETAIKVLNVSQRTIERYAKGFSEFGVTYFQHVIKTNHQKIKHHPILF